MVLQALCLVCLLLHRLRDLMELIIDCSLDRVFKN